jgi:hypothetical protein
VSNRQLVFRQTLGRGFAILVGGVEVIYITPAEARQTRTKGELYADFSRRLRHVVDKGGISKEEAAAIMHLVSKGV